MELLHVNIMHNYVTTDQEASVRGNNVRCETTRDGLAKCLMVKTAVKRRKS